MKKRTFFTTMILFLLFFHTAIFCLSIMILKEKLDAQKELALSEHYMLLSSMLKDMQALENRGINVEENIKKLTESYYYFRQNEKKGIFLYERWSVGGK